MSVVGPKGFVASGVAAGLKASGGLDVALVVNQGPNSAVAAVFTTNRCLANPILWSKQVVAGGHARAIVLNSAEPTVTPARRVFKRRMRPQKNLPNLADSPQLKLWSARPA